MSSVSILAVVLLGGGVLGVLAALVVHFKDRSKGSKTHSRISAGDDDDEDGEDEDEDDDDDDEGDDDDDDDDEDEDEDEGDGAKEEEDVEKGAVPRPESMKAFVALGDAVHSIVLPMSEIESWATLSQTIHETCEDSDVPDLPVHGIMHIVLNVNGKTVPVTGMTPLDELWKAKAIKVSITDEDILNSAGKPTRKKGKKKGKK